MLVIQHFQLPVHFIQYTTLSKAKNGGAYFSAKKFDLTTVLKSH